MAQRLDEQAVVSIARGKGVARRAPLANARTRVQSQPCLQLFCLRRVAFVTLLNEHRPDFLLKEIKLSTGQRLFLCLRATGNKCKYRK